MLIPAVILAAPDVNSAAFCSPDELANPTLKPALTENQRAEFSIGSDGSVYRAKGSDVVDHTAILDDSIRQYLKGQNVGIRIDPVWSIAPDRKAAASVCGVMPVDGVLDIPDAFYDTASFGPDVPRLRLFLTPDQGKLLHAPAIPVKDDTWPKAVSIAQDAEKTRIYSNAAASLTDKLDALNTTIRRSQDNVANFGTAAVKDAALKVVAHLDRPFETVPLLLRTPFDGDESGLPKPPISGVGEPGWHVRIVVDGAIGPVVDIAADGTWNASLKTPLAPGPHTFIVQMLDEAGNVHDPTASISYKYTVGAGPPRINNDLRPPGIKDEKSWEDAARQIGDAYGAAAPGLESLLKDVRKLRTKAAELYQVPNVLSATAYLAAWAPFSNAKPKAPPPDKGYCTTAIQTAVYEKPDLAPVWYFGTFELPTTTAENTVEMPLGSGGIPQRRIGEGPITAWATNVKAGSNLSFYWDEGNSTAPNLTAELAAFFNVVAKPPVLLGVPAPAEPDVVRQLRSISTAEACEQRKDLTIKPPLTTIAQFETRARTSRGVTRTGELKRDRNYTVYACTGTCVVSGPGSNVAVKAQAETPYGWRVTLVGGLLYSLRAGHDKGFNTYQWRRTTAFGAEQQVFELDSIPQPLSAASTALLLAVFLPEFCGNQLGIGAGPAVANLSGGGSFQEWSGQLLWRPWFAKGIADKVYLTMGVGTRSTSVPLADTVGTRIAIDATNGNATPPASPPLRTVWVFTHTFGIALDLSVFGDAASSLFGTKAPAVPASVPSGGSL
jgi:hypothetical protein